MATHQASTPVAELGYIRFKVAISATWGTASPSISLGGSSSNLDEVASSLAREPSAANFAATLLDLAPHPSFEMAPGARFDVTMDTDFCFFRVSISPPSDALQTRVGSQTLATSGSGTLNFGPSRALWLALGLRLGPQFGAFVSRIVPAIGPQAATAGSGFSTWVGPIGIAIPIGIAVRDFVNALCAAARARGLQRGHFNHVGLSYTRQVYAMRPRANADAQAQQAGQAQAERDIQRYGVASVRRYLEQNFRSGRAVSQRHNQAGAFDDREVNELGLEVGERMFRST